MAEFNVQQKATIDNYRSTHKLGFVVTDEYIAELIKKDMEQTGVVYAGFESLAKSVAKSHIKQPTQTTNANAKTNSAVSIFGTQIVDNEFDLGFSGKTTNTYPEIQPTESQSEAINFLKDITSDAETTFKNREDEAGALSTVVNTWQEVFNKQYAKSTVKKELQTAKEDLRHLEQASKGQIGYTDFLGNNHIRSFEDVFKQRRGVKFNEQAVADCTQKAEQFAAIKTSVEMINQTKQTLGYTTKGDVHSQMNPQEASSAIIKAFQLSGINSLDEMNKTLKDIEQKYKNHPDIQKYGGGFKFAKNKQGQYVIYRIAKNGYPAEATNEQLRIIAKEMGLRLDKALATALGVEYSANATPEEMANLTQQTFDKYQKEYEDSFAKAYGKKDVKALAEAYVLKQQQGVANIEMGLNVLSMALMLVPGGVVGTSSMLLKGGKFVQTAQKMAKVGATLTKVSQVASPFAMATMTLRPTELLEQLTSKNGMSTEEWKAWEQGVLQNSIYMAAGMGVSKIAQNGAAMYKTKALVNSLKSAGKSTDEIMAMIKANPGKFPNEIVARFNKIDNIAKAIQISTEFVLDLGSTIVLNKVMNNGDLLPMDVVNSIAFAFMGGVVQKDIARLNGDVDKIDFIIKEFKEFGVTEADAKNILQAMDDISTGKIRAKNVKPLDDHQDTQMLDEVVVTAERSRTEADGQRYSTNDVAEVKGEVKVEVETPKAEIPLGQRLENTSLREEFTTEKGTKVSKPEFGLNNTKAFSLIELTQYAKSLHDIGARYKSSLDDLMSQILSDAGIETKSHTYSSRVKGEGNLESLKYKIIKEMGNSNPQAIKNQDLQPGLTSIYDLFGAKFNLDSQESIDAFFESLYKAVENGKIVPTYIANYKGPNSKAIFSEQQIMKLKSLTERLGLETEYADNMLSDGYTGLNFSCLVPECGNMATEIQVKTPELDYISRVSHPGYDIMNNKNIMESLSVEEKEVLREFENVMRKIGADETLKSNYEAYIEECYRLARENRTDFPRPKDYNLPEILSIEKLDYYERIISKTSKTIKLPDRNIIQKTLNNTTISKETLSLIQRLKGRRYGHLQTEYKIVSDLVNDIDSRLSKFVNAVDFEERLSQGKIVLEEIRNSNMSDTEKHIWETVLASKLLPKTETHFHCKGATSQELIEKLMKKHGATPEQIEDTLKVYKEGEDGFDNLSDFCNAYGRISRWVRDADDIAAMVEDNIRIAVENNIGYIELRNAIVGVRNMSPEEVLQAMIKGIENAKEKYGDNMPATTITVGAYRGIHPDSSYNRYQFNDIISNVEKIIEPQKVEEILDNKNQPIEMNVLDLLAELQKVGHPKFDDLMSNYNKVIDNNDNLGKVKNDILETLSNGNEAEKIRIDEQIKEYITKADGNVSRALKTFAQEHPELKDLNIDDRVNKLWASALDWTTKELEQTIDAVIELAQKPEYQNILTGFDLNGPEAHTNPEIWEKQYQKIIEYNKNNPDNPIGITIHAGETFDTSSVDGTQQFAIEGLVAAVEKCGANRIGHGLQLAEFPEFITWLKENHPDVTIEANPTCNVLSIAPGCERLDMHPIDILNQNGISTTICSDDPAICATNSSLESAKVAMMNYYANGELTGIEGIANSSINGVKTGFMPKNLKDATLSKFESQIAKVKELFYN